MHRVGIIAGLSGLLLSACLIAAPNGSTPPTDGAYDFSGAKPEALARYRRGWIEILAYGRWTEAERLYRETVSIDPDFVVAKSVLARITQDPGERQALYESVQAALPTLRPDDRLLLNTYQRTLELFAKREAGETPDPSLRREMAAGAVRDYGNFLTKHPREWSVVIEYLEWVHALDGAEAALAETDRLRSASDTDLSFSYFEAYFYAEIGEHTKARELADAFEASIDDPTAPQPHYLNAYLLYERGEFAEALTAVERALALDPRHLIAERLRTSILARN